MIDPVKRKYNRENFRVANAALAHLSAFPFFGTLLGLVRDGDIIKDDDDVDFYVDIVHREEVISCLIAAGFHVSKDVFPNYSPYFVQGSKQINGVNTFVDVVLYEDSDQKNHIVDRWNFSGRFDLDENHIHIRKSILFPLKKSKFLGCDVLVPRKANICCEFLYGKKWKIKKSKSGGEYKAVIFNNVPKIISKNSYEYFLFMKNNSMSVDLDCLKKEKVISEGRFIELSSTRSALENEVHQLKSIREQLRAERDCLLTDLQEVTASRDSLSADLQEVTASRDSLLADLLSQRAASAEAQRQHRRVLSELSNRISEIGKIAVERGHINQRWAAQVGLLNDRMGQLRAELGRQGEATIENRLKIIAFLSAYVDNLKGSSKVKLQTRTSRLEEARDLLARCGLDDTSTHLEADGNPEVWLAALEARLMRDEVNQTVLSPSFSASGFDVEAKEADDLSGSTSSVADLLYPASRDDEIELLQASLLFDPVWYLSTYPDVAALELEPIRHYLWIGALLGYAPSRNFDAQAYLSDYPDVAAAGINPLVHYLANGILEGRSIRPV